MPEDPQLLTRWKDGDRAAGSELVGRHYDSVCRFFATKAGLEADDLVQRTFLRLSEAAERFEGTASFRAFLFGIARNVLYEHIRSRIRDGRADPDFHVSALVDLDPRASTVAVRRAEQRQLVAALQRLPVEQQMLLELFYWEELSIVELARAFGVAEGTVKSRLHRARAQLESIFDALPPEDVGSGSVRELLSAWVQAVGDRIEVR